MPGPQLTRRQALVLGGAGAAALALPAAAPAVRRRGLLGGFVPELVGVSRTGFEAWWPTAAAADTTVRVVRADGTGGVKEVRLARGNVVHAARVGGLEPDTAYEYELRSGGTAIARSAENPGRFTTLPRLEGRRLARIALLNDLHVGEDCSGTIQTIGGESYPPCFSADDFPDYAFRMCRAAVREIAERKPDLVVANGDLTDIGRPEEVARALALLRGIGLPVLVTRGNHDRRFRREGEPTCSEDADCLREQAFPNRAPGDSTLTSVAKVGGRVAVVGLDSCDPDSGTGRLDQPGQLAWLDATLARLRKRGRICVVSLHHHVATQANATHPPPLLFGVRADLGADDAMRILGRHGVPLAFSGHTHRNYLASDSRAPGTWFLENGAIKEYPAGYAILDVHEDGIVRTFHRPISPFSRIWVKQSAEQVYGLQPQYTRGTLRSRAFVLRFDGSGGSAAPGPSIIGPL